MRNFLLRHRFAMMIVMAPLLGAGGAAAGLSRAVTISIVAALALLISLWEIRSPAPPRSRKKIQQAIKPVDNEQSAKPRVPYVSPYKVTFDNQGLAVTFHEEKRESVLWADLAMVIIRIEDSFLPQPWWMLVGRLARSGCMYPSDAVGARELLHEMQVRLPGFDNLAVIEAMGMMSGGVHVWKHPEWNS